MSESKPSVWVLTDRRYLAQRMPSALLEWLAGHTETCVVLADDPGSSWDALRAGDVVVTRSRHPHAGALLAQAEARGAYAIDGAAASAHVRDKGRATAALARRGVPVPATKLVRDGAELAGLSFPIVVKPVFGDNARGVRVVRDPAEVGALPEGMLAQSYVETGGIDLKVYVAGRSIWAVRRPSPIVSIDFAAVRAPVTGELRRLVEACRAEFGLALFGLDVLESPDGPVVVDVNEFPNYTGIDEAPAAIGSLVLAAMRRAA